MVTTHFLDMFMSSSSTAEGIFSKMDEALLKYDISWTNCVGIGLDKHGAYKLDKNESTRCEFCSVNHCPCHIVHNIASKAGEAYEKVNLSIMLLHVIHFFCIGIKIQH